MSVESTNPDVAESQTGADVAGEAQANSSGSRRMLSILAAILVAVVLPIWVIGALIGEFAGAAMFLGVLLGAVGSKVGGTRRMLYLSPAFGVATGLAAFTAYNWWWVALLGGLGVVTGGGIRFGWHASLLMLPIGATFATPVSSVKDAIVFGVVAAIGTLYGVILARRFGAPEVLEGERLPLSSAAVVAIVFGIAVGGAAAIGVALGWAEPYWVPDPILILTLFILIGKRERIRHKAIGTALGAAASVPVAIIAPSPIVTGVIALVAFVLALSQWRKRYWLGYSLFTFSLILALAAPGQVGSEAKYRGVEILSGIGLLVVGLFIMHALGRWLAKRDPQPELAPA